MSIRKTKEQFIDEAIKIHGDKYDYSEVEYKNNNTKVKIFCNKCKKYFWQTPNKHIYRKQGCPYCASKHLTEKDMLLRFYKIHGKKFKYLPFSYKNIYQKIKIQCNKCGKEFEQKISNHLSGHGCIYCNSKLKSLKQFIDEAIKIHGDKYDYSEVEYKNKRTKIEIKCNKCHRIFLQTPQHHLHGQGCPSCNISFGEQKIEEYLKVNKINYISQKRFKDCKDKRLLPFDFYLPDYNICIEYQGEQHYKIKMFKCIKKSFFKGLKIFIKLKKHDIIKKKYCKKNKIQLIEIKYNENIEEKLKGELK